MEICIVNLQVKKLKLKSEYSEVWKGLKKGSRVLESVVQSEAKERVGERVNWMVEMVPEREVSERWWKKGIHRLIEDVAKAEVSD